jgi:hypothetical protein
VKEKNLVEIKGLGDACEDETSGEGRTIAEEEPGENDKCGAEEIQDKEELEKRSQEADEKVLAQKKREAMIETCCCQEETKEEKNGRPKGR